jgi:hypothetical protein
LPFFGSGRCVVASLADYLPAILVVVEKLEKESTIDDCETKGGKRKEDVVSKSMPVAQAQA